ncbi:MAG: alkaline phosphatase family protein, partial [Maioricimonas sp. JB049]
MGTTPAGKLVVIGLDGATFDIIDPLVAQGALPHLAGLLKAGTSGRLKSTHPPLTPPAWTTFSTGRTPAGHGIFDWTLSPFDVTGPPRFTNFNAVKAATFWEILNDRGLDCGIVNLPITYPPKPMKGFLVSGMDTPNEQVTFTYPDALAHELAQHNIDHRSYFSVKDEPTTSMSAMPEQLTSDETGFQTLLEHERTIRDSVLFLLRNKPWDVLVGVFMLADKVGHYFWHLRDQEGTSAKRDPVQRAYQELDGYVGEILESVPPDSHIVVVSDHGFGDSRRAFFINAWLRQEGFLSLKPRTFGLRLRTLKVRRVTRTGDAILRKAHLGFLKKLLPAGLLKREYTFPVPKMRQSVDLVDWSRTQAYGASYGVYINLEGRTGHGTVKAGAEYDALRNQIRERLQ